MCFGDTYSAIELIPYVWWADLDSNQGIPKESDLQSDAIATRRPTHITRHGPHPLEQGSRYTLASSFPEKVGSRLPNPSLSLSTGPADAIVLGAIAGVNEEWSRLPLLSCKRVWCHPLAVPSLAERTTTTFSSHKGRTPPVP